MLKNYTFSPTTDQGPVPGIYIGNISIALLQSCRGKNGKDTRANEIALLVGAIVRSEGMENDTGICFFLPVQSRHHQYLDPCIGLIV